MKNFTMKRVLAGALCAAGVIASALTTASACTTIYAGANLTQENTRFIARSEDYGHEQALVCQRARRLQRHLPRLPGIRTVYL